MVMTKRCLAESIELWGPRLHKASMIAKAQQKQEQHSSSVDSGTICNEELKAENESFSFEEASVSPKPSIDGLKLKDIKKYDKKSIKELLGKILPTTTNDNPLISPFPANVHLILPKGTFPMIVNDQDPSSIIAFSLISRDYRKALENMNSSVVEDVHSSPAVGSRKSEDGIEESEDKKKPNSSHIDLTFSDSNAIFTCVVYFAKEFDQFRANVMKAPDVNRNLYKELKGEKDLSVDCDVDIQKEISEVREHFARSLRKSRIWEAKGGKSGSKFNKTEGKVVFISY